MEDLIVESRHWRHGVEIVSHVNHSQLGRVRMALGISFEPWRSPLGGGGPRLVWDRQPAPSNRPTERPRWGRRLRTG